VTFPLAAHVHEGFSRLRSADLRPVAAAALLHIAMLVASALCWRRAFAACGGRIGWTDACMRYGVGTFLNAVTPARAGGAVRIGLFARSLTGESALQRSAAAMVGIGSVRAAAVSLVLAGAAAAGLAPMWLLAAPVLPAVAAAVARWRLHTVRAHLKARDSAALFAWAALAAACRCASIGAALMAVGVRSPVAAGMIGLIGLELSALIPLAPGLAGVGGAAVAIAIAAHGVPSATAFAGGVAFYVAEAAAGVAFGAIATAGFIVGGGTSWRQPAEGEVPVPVW
jgi:uncharacterized membrane protein YbhN (UPF0104 family)